MSVQNSHLAHAIQAGKVFLHQWPISNMTIQSLCQQFGVSRDPDSLQRPKIHLATKWPLLHPLFWRKRSEATSVMTMEFIHLSQQFSTLHGEEGCSITVQQGTGNIRAQRTHPLWARIRVPTWKQYTPMSFQNHRASWWQVAQKL